MNEWNFNMGEGETISIAGDRLHRAKVRMDRAQDELDEAEREWIAASKAFDKACDEMAPTPTTRWSNPHA